MSWKGREHSLTHLHYLNWPDRGMRCTGTSEGVVTSTGTGTGTGIRTSAGVVTSTGTGIRTGEGAIQSRSRYEQ